MQIEEGVAINEYGLVATCVLLGEAVARSCPWARAVVKLFSQTARQGIWPSMVYTVNYTAL